MLLCMAVSFLIGARLINAAVNPEKAPCRGGLSPVRDMVHRDALGDTSASQPAVFRDG